MPAIHSQFNEATKSQQYGAYGNFAKLPVKTSTRGPAPRTPLTLFSLVLVFFYLLGFIVLRSFALMFAISSQVLKETVVFSGVSFYLFVGLFVNYLLFRAPFHVADVSRPRGPQGDGHCR